MSGVAGRSGRKTFAPTPEQRGQVKILVGLGIPQEKICMLVINPQTGKPLDPKSLRKHFKREIAISTTEPACARKQFHCFQYFRDDTAGRHRGGSTTSTCAGRSRFFLPRPGWAGKKPW